MTRLVVVDAVVLAVFAVYAVWVSRIHSGSRINLLRGRTPAGRERWAGTAIAGLVPGGLLFGSDGYGWGTRWVNPLVLFGALMVVVAVVQIVHNRTRARR